jgi:hypothetical protein
MDITHHLEYGLSVTLLLAKQLGVIVAMTMKMALVWGIIPCSTEKC